MYLQLQKRKHWIISLIIPLLLASCAGVMLIGAYDQVVDQNIQKIQNDVSTLLVKAEKNIIDRKIEDNKYENFRDAYSTIEGEIESLKIRCRSLTKYRIITQQVDLLEDNVRNLEAFHKTGLTDTAQTEQLKRTMEFSFQKM